MNFGQRLTYRKGNVNTNRDDANWKADVTLSDFGRLRFLAVLPQPLSNIAPGVFHNATCTGNEDADMIVVYSEGIRRFEPE